MFRDLPTLWKIKRYRFLLTARAISNIGNGMSPVALAFGVLGLPGSTPASLSLVTTAQMVPIVVFLLIGGVVADRFGRAQVVGTTDIIGSIAVGVSAILFLSGHATVPLLCVIAVIIGILNALWWPAFAGLLPEIVPPELISPALSIQGLSANLGFTIGASIGGAIVSIFGAGWAILLDAASFMIAGLLVLQLKNAATSSATDEHRESMLAQLKEGWKEFSSRRWLVTLVISFAFINMCFEGFIGVLAPVQMKEQLGGAKDMGLMLFAFGLGSISGVLVSLKFRPKFPLRVAMMSMPVVGLFVLAVAIPLPLWIIAIVAVGAGISFDLFFVLWMTTFQTQIPQEALSRVSSYDAFGSMLFAPIGLLVAGPLAQWIGARDALFIAGSIVLLASFGSLLVRDIRDIESVVNQPEITKDSPSTTLA